MNVLDLFAGEGGASWGYMEAGAHVTAVDNDPARLERNPAPVKHLGDAVDFAVRHGHKYDLRHASPTCTGYSQGTVALPDRLTRYDRLIPTVREVLVDVGGFYVIENVFGARAEMVDPTMLCWSMFHEPGSVLDVDGTPLTMRRHRMFEANFPIGQPRACRHPRGVQVAGAYGGARRDAWEARYERQGGYVPADLAVLRELTGLPWASERGTFLSIPPAFAGHVLAEWREHVGA